MSNPVSADIIDHSVIPNASDHRAWMARDCKHCQRITKLRAAFREFGYTDLTIAEQRDAYHTAMTLTCPDSMPPSLNR